MEIASRRLAATDSVLRHVVYVIHPRRAMRFSFSKRFSLFLRGKLNLSCHGFGLALGLGGAVLSVSSSEATPAPGSQG